MHRLLNQFLGKRVLVVGDLMVDIHLQTRYRRPCPEADAPVLEQLQQQRYPGGAAHVAMQCRSLGADVMLVGAAGHDPHGEWLFQTLTFHGIVCPWMASRNRRQWYSTTTKMRIYQEGQLTCRVDRDCLHEWHPQELIDMVSLEPSFDAILFSDYQKGAFRQGIRELFKDLQWLYPEAMIGINPKPSLAKGFPPGLDLILLNSGEADGLRKEQESLVELYRRLKPRQMLVTHAEKGLTALGEHGFCQTLRGHRVKRPDPVGAGDATFAAAMLAQTVTEDPLLVARIANAAGAAKVAKRGPSPLKLSDLERFLPSVPARVI